MQMDASIGARLDRLPLSGYHWRLLGLMAAGMYFECADADRRHVGDPGAIVGVLGAERKRRLVESIAADTTGVTSAQALEGGATAAVK